MTCKRRTPKGSDCGCNKGVACQCWNFMGSPDSRPYANIVYVFENYPTADETHTATLNGFPGGTIHWTGLHTLFNFTRVISIDRETCEVDMTPVAHGLATRRCTTRKDAFDATPVWIEQDFTMVTTPNRGLDSMSMPLSDGGTTDANGLWRLLFNVTAVGPRRLSSPAPIFVFPSTNVVGCNLVYDGMCHSADYEFGSNRAIGLWSGFCPGWDSLVDFAPEEIQSCVQSPSTGYWYRV